MDPYLRKLLCANPYLWIQTICAIFDGSLLEETSICANPYLCSQDVFEATTILFDPAAFFNSIFSGFLKGFPIVSLKPFMAEAGQEEPDAVSEGCKTPTKTKNAAPGESPLPKGPAAPMKRPSSSKVATPKKGAKAKATPKKAMKKKPVQKETKQKAKAKAKTQMKRPAAPQPSEVPDPAVPMKRPASAGASSSWKDGLASASSPPRDLGADLGGEEPEEEAVLEFDPEIEVAAAGNQGQAQLRDRVKMQKFLGMLSANQLPKFLQKAWEESQTMKHGKRERQTLIVNSLFDRSEQGRLVMDLEKTIFKAMQCSYVDTSSKATSKSLPKLLFMGKFSLCSVRGLRAASSRSCTQMTESNTAGDRTPRLSKGERSQRWHGKPKEKVTARTWPSTRLQPRVGLWDSWSPFRLAPQVPLLAMAPANWLWQVGRTCLWHLINGRLSRSRLAKLQVRWTGWRKRPSGISIASQTLRTTCTMSCPLAALKKILVRLRLTNIKDNMTRTCVHGIDTRVYMCTLKKTYLAPYLYPPAAATGRTWFSRSASWRISWAMCSFSSRWKMGSISPWMATTSWFSSLAALWRSWMKSLQVSRDSWASEPKGLPEAVTFES